MGFSFKKFKEIVRVVGPAVMVAMPGGKRIGPIIPAIVDGIEEAEQLHVAKTGAEKKAHVLEIAKKAAEVTNATSKVKLNPDDVAQTVSDGIDTVIHTVNLVKQKHADDPVQVGSPGD